MLTTGSTSVVASAAVAVTPPKPKLKRCARCLYDEETPAIHFDERGVCNYCAVHDRLESLYPNGEVGAEKLKEIAATVKAAGRGKKYDVVVGVSGGCDSSVLLCKAIELGLRPLAVHFDNTWNSTIATENIRRLLKALKVDLYTVVVDNAEYDDLYRAFFKAGVADIEAPTDIGLATTLYRACAEHKIRYIFEGHSFRTEGVSPLGWLYMDAKYIQSIHRQYGELPMKTFPNLWLTSFLKWTAVNRIKKIRPLYYMDYNKEESKAFLAKEYGWQWYGGHHLENRFTAFYHSYFLPQRFGYDCRTLGYSALVRSGQLTAEEGAQLLANHPSYDPEIVELVKKRLGFSDAEFAHYMNLPKRNYREFKTYKPLFERMRPIFGLMAKYDLVPMSFYQKYTSKTNI